MYSAVKQDVALHVNHLSGKPGNFREFDICQGMSHWCQREFKVGVDEATNGVGYGEGGVPIPTPLRGVIFLFCDLEMAYFCEL